VRGQLRQAEWTCFAGAGEAREEGGAPGRRCERVVEPTASDADAGWLQLKGDVWRKPLMEVQAAKLPPLRTASTFDVVAVEEMTGRSASELVRTYAPFWRPVFVSITREELGFRSEGTEIEFVNSGRAVALGLRLDFEPVTRRSFLFCGRAGRMFSYNDFAVVLRRSR